TATLPAIVAPAPAPAVVPPPGIPEPPSAQPVSTQVAATPAAHPSVTASPPALPTGTATTSTATATGTATGTPTAPRSPTRPPRGTPPGAGVCNGKAGPPGAAAEGDRHWDEADDRDRDQCHAESGSDAAHLAHRWGSHARCTAWFVHAAARSARSPPA